jgi:phenylpropionate dioxygenase-like ring-hydroxylating dioxygenase large terminal subunit
VTLELIPKDGHLREEAAMFLRNCWYVAAWDHEVGPNQLKPSKVLGEVACCRFFGHEVKLT